MRDLRTYITGMGSSGALLGAILIAFATLAGIVAFNGMPGGSTDQTGVGDDVFVRADPAPGAPAGPDRDRTRGNARRPFGLPRKGPGQGQADLAGRGRTERPHPGCGEASGQRAPCHAGPRSAEPA